MRDASSAPDVCSRRPSRAQALARGILWSVLAMSLAGTVVTAGYLPAPWGQLVVVPSALGAVITAGFSLCHLTVGVTGCLTVAGRAARRVLRDSYQHIDSDNVKES